MKDAVVFPVLILAVVIGWVVVGNAIAYPPIFDVEMRGAWGVPFTLQCQMTAADGSSNSESVAGKVPEIYHHAADSLSCVGQSQDQAGQELTMQVLKRGVVLKSSTTTAPYGIVQIATR